ncbi:MAG: saccharopine dehydrogenase C-terminal domain-containing protein [Bacteroidales bacterium]
MLKKVTILGAGMVGKAIIHDLVPKYNVTAVDIDETALEYCRDNYNITTIQQDLNERSSVSKIIKDSEIIISAVPGYMGYKTMETVIKQGKPIVDISFMPEDFMKLDTVAKKHKLTAIADCGVAPGMPNIILGYENQNLKINKFEYMVGGLPKERKFPFEYKAPFSPIDVLEEYTRPARMMENGQIISKPAMSEPELVYFDGLGHLEAFNTDGLRSLLTTMNKVPYMKEKTLRYPGHIKLIQALKESGFFSNNKIDVGKSKISPVEITNRILMNNWKLGDTEEEFTIMKIILNGLSGKKNLRIVYDLFDQYDKETQFSSMARTTGFTATAALHLISQGIFTKKGVFPPEWIGKDEKSYNTIIEYLKNRGIIYRKSTEII